ncbi:hypothetical protein [Priestia megaterium]|uniref:hypothetical protein n=1 Tax=Priestia megaterium TaxID=1404 RepID=UPI000BF44734|nr:hypothetical protein [Priestia megaterium]PFW47054.1 hypothetical protein COL17_22335 [Priestia megaterium]
MQIHFERWVKEQDVSEDALALFGESIMCYRVGAYRASFLMSYLGFMKTLRDRLLKSPMPSLIPHESVWQKARNDLKDDKKWEEKVFDLTQESYKIQQENRSIGKIFLINMDLIEEMPYWRKKRNECAHAKDTIIGYSHVDTFWLFLESNLSKFVVNGGKEALLNKYTLYLDKRFTEPGTEFKHLINEIPLVVKQEEIADFYKQIEDNYITLDDQKNKIGYKFWHEIAYSPNQILNNAFLDYIVSDNGVLIRFLEVFPDKLLLLKINTQLIRHFWTELLFKIYRLSSESFWELSIILLRNNMIPQTEIQGFVTKIANKMVIWGRPSEDQTRELNQFGFLMEIRKRWFDSEVLNKVYTGYNTANQNSSLIMYYLKVAPLDEVVVRELNALFHSYTRGNFYDTLDRYIQKNPDFLTNFKRIAVEQDLNLADFFDRKISENDEE